MIVMWIFTTPPIMSLIYRGVNAYQLALAFVTNDEALNAVNEAIAFNGGKSTVTFVRGEVPVTIQCFRMAQGMCAVIDNRVDKLGPAGESLFTGFAEIFGNHIPMTEQELLELIASSGGPFMRD